VRNIDDFLILQSYYSTRFRPFQILHRYPPHPSRNRICRYWVRLWRSIRYYCIVLVIIEVNLGATFPNTLSLGMEIRDKVVEYVEDRIQKLRAQNEGKYGNIAVVLTNAMKYLPNFFRKGQVRLSRSSPNFFSSKRSFSYFRTLTSKNQITEEELSGIQTRYHF
jgi:hypothetical protein